jgi:predicted unusual protein kinase regulating ubiquinone biosynthesis (AarF/ABC1/UbiB family)
LGANPEDLFDTFATQSINAASIGQVHQATKNGKKLAVKIQYPGVANSIGSDLSLVKPIAIRMFNLKGSDTDKFFKEVEEKLLEETNYTLELEQGQSIATACSELPNISFPKYYPEWSAEKVLTMEWMEGQHLTEYVATSPGPSEANDSIGQTLWDFYMFQMHRLRKVHADPHPGNFLVDEKQQLIAIDFGCIKTIPESFYTPYFEMSRPEIFNDTSAFQERLRALEILLPTDTPEEIAFFTSLFHRMMALFTQPFHDKEFDFGDPVFWDAIAQISQEFSQNSELRRMNGNRGSKHFIYINRTFFGLYSLLNDLMARVKTFDYMIFV